MMLQALGLRRLNGNCEAVQCEVCRHFLTLAWTWEWLWRLALTRGGCPHTISKIQILKAEGLDENCVYIVLFQLESKNRDASPLARPDCVLCSPCRVNGGTSKRMGCEHHSAAKVKHAGPRAAEGRQRTVVEHSVSRSRWEHDPSDVVREGWLSGKGCEVAVGGGRRSEHPAQHWHDSYHVRC